MPCEGSWHRRASTAKPAQAYLPSHHLSWTNQGVEHASAGRGRVPPCCLLLMGCSMLHEPFMMEEGVSTYLLSTAADGKWACRQSAGPALRPPRRAGCYRGRPMTELGLASQKSKNRGRRSGGTGRPRANPPPRHGHCGPVQVALGLGAALVEDHRSTRLSCSGQGVPAGLGRRGRYRGAEKYGGPQGSAGRPDRAELVEEARAPARPGCHREGSHRSWSQRGHLGRRLLAPGQRSSRHTGRPCCLFLDFLLSRCTGAVRS